MDEIAVQLLFVVGLSSSIYIFTGVAGFPSLAQPSLGLLSTYVAAAATHDPYVLVPLAVTIGAGSGCFLGCLLRRMRGDQLLIGTFCVHSAITEFARSENPLTGDATGLFLEATTVTSTVIAFVVLFIAVVLLAMAATSGQRGAQAELLRTNEKLAATFGIPAERWFVLLFSVSSALVTACVSLMACHLRVISPNPITLDLVLLTAGAAIAGTQGGLFTTVVLSTIVIAIAVTIRFLLADYAIMAGPIRQVMIGVTLVALGVTFRKPE